MSNTIINQLDIVKFAKNCKEYDIDLFDNEKYGVVKVYGNENQPALFLKEVDTFDFKTLKQIAEIQKACWNFQKVLFLYVYTKTEVRIYNCSKKPFVYDDDDECYYCEVDMDEDDAARLMQGHYKECPYYQNDDEYAVVRHQM